MAPSQTIRLRITAEMRAALDTYCAEHGIELSDLLREVVLRKIGRKDLIDTMPGRGKPKSDS